jgi:hypothetical protein
VPYYVRVARVQRFCQRLVACVGGSACHLQLKKWRDASVQRSSSGIIIGEILDLGRFRQAIASAWRGANG